MELSALVELKVGSTATATYYCKNCALIYSAEFLIRSCGQNRQWSGTIPNHCVNVQVNLDLSFSYIVYL